MAQASYCSSTLNALRSCALDQRMPSEFMDCKSPLFFVNKNQRSSVFKYMKDVAADWPFLEGNMEALLRAMRYFDRFILSWNTETNAKWTAVEDSLNKYKAVMSLVLSRTIGRDCADHVLSFIQRSEISEDAIERHDAEVLALAERTSVVCLALSAKFGEHEKISLYHTLASMTLDGRLTKNDLIEHELFVLSKIDWRLTYLAPSQFTELLYVEIGFTPDDAFKKAARVAVSFCSAMATLQSKSACVLSGVGILAALRRKSPRVLYPRYFEPLRVACGVDEQNGGPWLENTVVHVTSLIQPSGE